MACTRDVKLPEPPCTKCEIAANALLRATLAPLQVFDEHLLHGLVVGA